MKEAGLLPRAEMLQRDAGEEGELGAPQTKPLLLSLVCSAAGEDAAADPGGAAEMFSAAAGKAPALAEAPQRAASPHLPF